MVPVALFRSNFWLYFSKNLYNKRKNYETSKIFGPCRPLFSS